MSKFDPMKNLGLLILLSALLSTQAFAQKLYKWVDEWGDTHYSEELPEGVSEHVAFNFPDSYETSDPKEDYYSIQNQLKRIQARKLEEQKSDREVRQQQPRQQTYVDHYQPRRYYYPVHQRRHYPVYPYKYNKPKYCCSNSKPQVKRPPARITQANRTFRSSAGFSASR